MDVLTEVKIIIGFVGAGLSYSLGGIDNLLITLICFMVVDYVTGVLAGVYTQTVNSSRGIKGIIKKLMQVFLVFVAASLDRIAGTPDLIIRNAFIFFLLANEGISIIENAGRAGVAVPDFIKNRLEEMKKVE